MTTTGVGVACLRPVMVSTGVQGAGTPRDCAASMRCSGSNVFFLAFSALASLLTIRRHCQRRLRLRKRIRRCAHTARWRFHSLRWGQQLRGRGRRWQACRDAFQSRWRLCTMRRLPCLQRRARRAGNAFPTAARRRPRQRRRCASIGGKACSISTSRCAQQGRGARGRASVGEKDAGKCLIHSILI